MIALRALDALDPLRLRRLVALVAAFVLWAAAAPGQDAPYSAPPRAEGEGPYPRLILRGVTVIDGTGAPARGPVDLVIEGNRITRLVNLGAPGLAIDPTRRPPVGEGGRELDLTGRYVLPGFLDLYGHLGSPTPEYVNKLSLAHGITTVREPLCSAGVERCVELAARSARNEITSPRLVPYVYFGVGRPEGIRTAEEARVWVATMAQAGAAGIKFRGVAPDLLAAALAEARQRGLGTSCHLAQQQVARVDALEAARQGTDLLEHWYGLPEALLADGTVQDFPPDYNDNDEQARFAQAGRLWKQAAPRGSARWIEVLDELVRLGVTLVPTLGLYEANRDLMAARTAEWHERYTLPSLWDAFRPSRKSHAAHFFYWTSEDEVAWRENFRLWMSFLDDFKDRGGRVATGSDAGFMYHLYGFGFVRELELLREAGFHPLEVIRAATLAGAEALDLDHDLGSIEPGKLADLVVVGENPLANLKVLYGTGALALTADDRPVRIGGVELTVKDGIVYDARQLLADVRRLVSEAKAREGRDLVQPGLEAP